MVEVIQKVQKEGKDNQPYTVWEELKRRVRAEVKVYAKKRGWSSNA